MRFGVARQGGASQAFQDTQLDFLRSYVQKAIKAFCKTLKGFTWQAKYQISVQVRIGCSQKPT